ncbi:MAG: sulfite exporter TauE/SafE family protein [Acidobacteria bacterium]|nr:sulfite exporter TauE/SafE family protein [Acidobacteriota bacterium]
MPRADWCRLLAAIFLFGTAICSVAHPMGNFSVNHYAGIRLDGGSLELRYIIDMAEIPTFQELQGSGIKAELQAPGLTAYLRSKQAALLHGIGLQLDGQRLPLTCSQTEVLFPPGAGGLPTMKLAFTCRASLRELTASCGTIGLTCGKHRIEYRDDNFPGRAGWKEVIVRAQGELDAQSDVPAQDRSAGLSNYPTDLLNSPPQDLAAHISFNAPLVTRTLGLHLQSSRATASTAEILSRFSTETSQRQTLPASTPAPLVANHQSTPRNAFTQIIAAQHLSIWFVLLAGTIAAGLGALHALEPGHGKTLVAAYLVGSRGTPSHAVLLGTIVTLAHTGGVYALGAVTLYAAQYVAPERIYPWLGLVSGLAIAILGILLLLKRLAGKNSASREDHRHWYDNFFKSQDPTTNAGTATAPSLRQLLVLGITGGMIPCPGALVVLLSAVALHRTAFGLFLIVCFSVGLAAILIGIGLLIVQSRRLLSRLRTDAPLLQRYLPSVSALLIALVGVGLTLQSLASVGIRMQAGSFSSPKWILVAGIGLLLGMRHSTDADHVIAVTTIVTRLRSVRSASLVGGLWGIGHTLTIFVVGSLIILFRLVIPPRVGLSMEFAVALMLILLGVLNLTGILAWLKRRLSPAEQAPARIPAAERVNGGRLAGLSGFQFWRPLAIGTVHGLAGSAAVALLVLASIHDALWAIGYLLLFGLGTIAGMMLMTAVIALPVVWTDGKFARLNRYICTASGIVSIAFGLFLVYQIGFVSGLFHGVPTWTPE